MKIIEKDGIITFELEQNDVESTKTFLGFIKDFKLQRHGSSIFMYRKDELMACFNPFDNSLFIVNPDAYALADHFKTKRFPVGEARTALETWDEKQVQSLKVQKFERDLSCPIAITTEQKSTEFKAATLKEVLEIYHPNTAQFYSDMTKFFDQYADFSKEKKDNEYTPRDKADKFCRLNLDSEKPKDGIVTEHLFLIDSQKKKVIGTVNATICITPKGLVDVYFYDEIVDYTIRLSPVEQAKVNELKQDLDKNKDALNALVNPKRMELMKELFIEARAKIVEKIKQLNSQVDWKNVRGFIRAAGGRESLYGDYLGCSKKNDGNFVIQERVTTYPKQLLDDHIKDWATEKLAALKGLDYLAQSAMRAMPKPEAQHEPTSLNLSKNMGACLTN